MDLASLLLVMSAVKDKEKKRHGAASLAVENGDKAAKRKSKHRSRKLTRTQAPKELVSAVKEGNLETIRRMLGQNEELKDAVVDQETFQTLFHAAIRSGQVSVVECLISAGASTGGSDLKQRNALHHLARVKDTSQALVDAVVRLQTINAIEKDSSGATPLHLAIRYKNFILATTLISTLRSHELNVQDVTGLTPLHYACHEGFEAIVKALLDAGANAKKVDDKGNTAMHYACDTGSIPIGRILLAAGVDVMAANNKGDTPLHRAVEKKQEMMCGWLVNNGAEVRIRYEKRLYEARHKVQTRKYLRQAAREARAGGPKLITNDDGEDEDSRASDSDGKDLPDDPEGMLSLHDHLDAYGFLIGSEKSNQLQAAENRAAAGNAGSDDEDEMGALPGPSAEALHEREKSQRKLIKKWVKITKAWTEKGATATLKSVGHDKLRKLIYKGIPNHVRAGVWRCISGILDMKEAHAGEYEQLLTRPVSKGDGHQLDVDINRTNRTHFLFKERYGQGQISLFSILHAYIMYDPGVGYCQGMSDLTSLMMQYLAEEEAFWMLVRFMKDPLFNMAGRFENGFKDLKRSWYVHDKLVALMLPRLHAVLSGAQIEAAHYTIKWYLKCFLDALSFDIVLRIWDVFLLEGSDVLYSFVITLLKYHEPSILAMDQGELLMSLPAIKGPPTSVSVDAWLKEVKKNPIKTKIIRNFEAEFEAAWPAMQAAAKAEADRKQTEWLKRREKMEKARLEAEAKAAEESSSAPNGYDPHSHNTTSAAGDAPPRTSNHAASLPGIAEEDSMDGTERTPRAKASGGAPTAAAADAPKKDTNTAPAAADEKEEPAEEGKKESRRKSKRSSKRSSKQVKEVLAE